MSNEIGVDIIQNCEVKGIKRNGDSVEGIETTKGFIKTKKIGVVAAGHSSVIENIRFLWIKMNLNLNKNVEMSEDEIELEHENILFMQPMWKWQTNWIRVMTWTWRLGAALKNLKFTWIKTNMNLSTRHSCNKCGNEWRSKLSHACED